jgi:hypothetical protein
VHYRGPNGLPDTDLVTPLPGSEGSEAEESEARDENRQTGEDVEEAVCRSARYTAAKNWSANS